MICGSRPVANCMLSMSLCLPLSSLSVTQRYNCLYRYQIPGTCYLVLWHAVMHVTFSFSSYCCVMCTWYLPGTNQSMQARLRRQFVFELRRKGLGVAGAKEAARSGSSSSRHPNGISLSERVMHRYTMMSCSL